VLVCTLRPAEGQEGLRITFDAGAYALEGRGAITVDELIEYDRLRQLEWVDEGTRAWVLSRGQAPAGAAQSATSRGAPEPRSRGLRIRWAIVVPVAVVAAAAVAVLVVVLPGRIATIEKPWPGVFQGTWQYKYTSDGLLPAGRPQVIISRRAGDASIRLVASAGSWSDFAVSRDAVTVTMSGDPKPAVYRRTSPGGADLLGRYGPTHAAAQGYGYQLEFDGAVLKLTIFAHGVEPEWITFRLSKDGKTMVMQNGGSGLPGTDVYGKVDEAASG
jgi:hypothetical protein